MSAVEAYVVQRQLKVAQLRLELLAARIARKGGAK